MSNKLFIPLAGLITGIFLSDKIFPNLTFSLFCFGSAFIVWIILTVKSKDPLKGIKSMNYHFIWIYLLFSGIGSIDYFFRIQPFIEREIENSKIEFIGEIRDIKYLTEGDRFKLKINQLNDSIGRINFSNLNILLYTNGYAGSIGDEIKFRATPKRFKSLSYEEKMRHEGISYYINAKYDKISSVGQSSSINTRTEKFRNNLIVIIEKSNLSRTTSEFLISLLLGDKTLLSSEIKQTLSSAGLAHILALSGMHVAIIFSIVFFILFPLSILGLHKTRRIICLILIWGYVLFTGASPSTVRAAIMLTLAVGAILLERKNSSLNALMAAGLIILFYNPLDLWNVGLQLSFICVASIIVFTNKLNPVDRHSHPKIYSIINLTLISFITSFCTWTLVAYYFKNLPVLFLPSNLLLLPLLPVFITFSIIYVSFIAIGIDIDFMAQLLDLFQEIYIGSTKFLSLSGTTIDISLSLMTTILWLTGCFVIGITLYSSSKKFKNFGLILSSLLLVGTVSSMFVFNEGKNDNLKFMHSLTKFEVTANIDKKITKLEFPRKSISSINHANFQIITVDQMMHPDSIRQLATKNNNKDNENINKYLLVGTEANNNQIAELISQKEFTKIILHAGIGKKKKAELLHLLNESEWDKVYSLRENGSLEFDL